MKKLKGRIWISVIIVLMLILLGWVTWQSASIFKRYDSYEKSTVMLNGVYSIDGGEWKKIDNKKPIDEHFHKAVFKGKPTTASGTDLRFKRRGS